MPSLIDFDNKIAFMSISHKSLIETLNNLILETFLENTEKGFDRNWSKEEIKKWKDSFKQLPQISYHEYEKYSSFEDFQDLEKYFHKNTNTLQIFTSLTNEKMPKTLTYRIDNPEIIELKEMLEINNIKYNTLTSLSNKEFHTLNGSGKITGEIYYPTEEEENIPEGKILIIPTASEEYFLPAISQMNGKGCIITEKGSETSHLIINSKEFNFNIILVDNATELFKQGDIIEIDFDRKIFK
jgi:phosphohistidine swiveling domain-containing protein